MLLTDEHHQFRMMVRDYVEREINPNIPAWEEAGMMPLHDIFASMGKLGLLGLGYDTACGGQGADHIFTLILAEEFGRCDHGSLPMALGVQTDMATPSLARFGSPPSEGAVPAARTRRCHGRFDRRQRTRRRVRRRCNPDHSDARRRRVGNQRRKDVDNELGASRLAVSARSDL